MLWEASEPVACDKNAFASRAAALASITRRPVSRKVITEM